MTLERQILTRVFIYAGLEMPDPDPTMQPVAVRDFFAAAGRPELSSAEVRGPEVVGNQLQFTLHRAVGTKGQQATADTATTAEEKLELANIKVPGWISDRLAGFRKGAVRPQAQVNSLIEILAKAGNGDCIRPPAQAIRWFF